MKIKSSLKRGSSQEKILLRRNSDFSNNEKINNMNNFKMVRFATELTTVKKFHISDTPRHINLQDNDFYFGDEDVNANKKNGLKDPKYLLSQLGLDFDDMDDLIDLVDLNKLNYSRGGMDYNYNLSSNNLHNNNTGNMNQGIITNNDDITNDEITDDETIVDTLNLDDFSLTANTDDFMNFANLKNHYSTDSTSSNIYSFDHCIDTTRNLENIDLANIKWELIEKNLVNINENDNMAQINDILRQQNIKLTNLNISNDFLEGEILVNNLNYEKNIEIKFTFNNWSNINYINAVYDSSINGDIDKFLFVINLKSFNFYLKCQDIINTDITTNPNKSELIDLKFCCRYMVNNETYYDNNNYKNYELKFNIFKQPMVHDYLNERNTNIFDDKEYISPIITPESTPEIVDLSSLNILDEIISNFDSYANDSTFEYKSENIQKELFKVQKKKHVSRIFNENTDYYNTSPLKHLYHNDPIGLKPVSLNKVITNTISSSSATDSLASSISPSISSSISSTTWDDNELLLTEVPTSSSNLKSFQKSHGISGFNGNTKNNVSSSNNNNKNNYRNNNGRTNHEELSLKSNLNFEPLTWSDYDSSLSSSMSSSFSDFNEFNNEFNYSYNYDAHIRNSSINSFNGIGGTHNRLESLDDIDDTKNEIDYYSHGYDNFITDQDTTVDTLSINSNETLTVNTLKPI